MLLFEALNLYLIKYMESMTKGTKRAREQNWWDSQTQCGMSELINIWQNCWKSPFMKNLIINNHLPEWVYFEKI